MASKQRVLVVWEHGGKLGHLARLLPVIREMQGRGNDVALAVRRPETVKGLVPADVTVLRVPEARLTTEPGTQVLCAADVWLRLGFADTPAAKANLDQWLALLDVQRPTVVLVDASPFAVYAANLAGIPAVCIGHGYELPPAADKLGYAPWMPNEVAPGEIASQNFPQQVQASELALQNALTHLGELYANRLNGNVPRCVADVLSTAQQALVIWPELDHFDRLQTAGNYVGPIWSDVPHAATVTWPEKVGPKVFCYLTLQDKRYELLWQALQAQGANVMVVTPNSQTRACDAARAWGVTVHPRAIALDLVIGECDAVISNGGAGLMSMALQAGKRVMVVPDQLEQALLAYQMVRRGLAVSTLSLTHQQRMKDSVAKLLFDAVLGERSAKLAARYANYTPIDAVQKIVALICNAGANPTKRPMLENVRCP